MLCAYARATSSQDGEVRVVTLTAVSMVYGAASAPTNG